MELRRQDPDGWRRPRCTLVQRDPAHHVDGARSNRPVWILQELSELAEPGGLRTIEERILLPEGGVRWIETSLINRLEPDGGCSITSSR